jgi:hypothetical protein
LIFDQKKMTAWWQEGFEYAEKRFYEQTDPVRFDN